LARRRFWFSPMVAMFSVSASSTDLPDGIGGLLERVDVVAGASAQGS
jgi:hypothetical protein